VGRDINRPYIDESVLNTQINKPVVQGLFQLIRIRNQSTAFDGQFTVSGQDAQLKMTWTNGESIASLAVNLDQDSAVITVREGLNVEHFDIQDLATK
jgi:sucrose phosphorylase